jgi:hypothetical protein
MNKPTRNSPFARHIATGREEYLPETLLQIGTLVHRQGWGLTHTAMGAETALCPLPVEVKLKRYRHVCDLLHEAFPMTEQQLHDLHGTHDGSLAHYLASIQRIHQ